MDIQYSRAASMYSVEDCFTVCLLMHHGPTPAHSPTATQSRSAGQAGNSGITPSLKRGESRKKVDTGPFSASPSDQQWPLPVIRKVSSVHARSGLYSVGINTIPIDLFRIISILIIAILYIYSSGRNHASNIPYYTPYPVLVPAAATARSASSLFSSAFEHPSL